jgi:hypothetical protein
MEYIDQVAHRVSLCCLTGVLGGLSYATFKGFPQRATALKAAGSCAIVGTALFGAERIAYVAFQPQIDNERRLVLTSHAFSGVMGGGLGGYLYQKKPMRGMFIILPVMTSIGFLELAWEKQRRARIKEFTDSSNASRLGSSNDFRGDDAEE